MSVKDKYSKTLKEVDSLKHELETRTEVARRSQARATDLKQKVSQMNKSMKSLK